MPKKPDLTKWKKCKGCKQHCKVVACKKEESKYFGKYLYFCPKDEGEQCEDKNGKSLWVGIAPAEFRDLDPPEDEEEQEPKKQTRAKRKAEIEEGEVEEDNGLSEDEKREITAANKNKKRKIENPEKAFDPIYTQNEMGKKVSEIHSHIVVDQTVLNKIDYLVGIVEKNILKLDELLTPK